ncbi:MAG: hypothetical protein HKL89_09850 [Candidatus Dormibacteraeota bacterium]|nr:hypothetical protein [Candidatus Dormibacteraeota bacterium]
MLSSAPLQDSNPGPLIAELVDPAETAVAPRRLWALLIAAAPLAARLGWWWWRQSRATEGRQATPGPRAVVFEHTEVRMTKRLLGRWKVRVTSTRWQPGGGPEPVAARLLVARPGQLARLLLLGLGRLPGPTPVGGGQPTAKLPPATSRDQRG